MTPENWTRVRDLFEQALASNADPKEWIASQGQVDEAIKHEVIALLEHDAAAGDFLEHPPEVLEKPAFEPGRSLGPYQIIREAGEGGSGRVYVALDSRLDRRVALKEIRGAKRGAEERERLRREAKAAAALAHPGICMVYALEDLDDDLYIASELVEGRTLRQEISQGHRPTDSALLENARELVSALACAHDAGVTHGDLKPENVMRTYDGRLKILDFGLAQLEAGSTDGSAGRSSSRGGTPGYMAPELVNGRFADARSDVFALGVLLYEQATCEHPFRGQNRLEMMQRVLNDDPVPLASLRPEIGEPLRSVIERCLMKAPAERFASAADVSRALHPSSPRRTSAALDWWRLHHMIVIAVYAAAAIVSWQVQDRLAPGARLASAAFFIMGVATTIAVIFRAHLLFTQRLHGDAANDERRRTGVFTLAVDVLIAALLVVDCAIVAERSPLATVLIASLAVGLVLARLLIEPSTTRAAFPER